MAKLLHKDKKTKGNFFENNDIRIDIKYSDEAIERELIKFTIKEGNEFIISSQDILALIQEQFKQKSLAAALTTTDTTFVPSVEVAIPICFDANKDIKMGERVMFWAPFQFPIGVALVAEAYKLCSIKGKEILKIPMEEFKEASETLAESSKEFVEKVFKPQIDALKKEREASEVTKEEINN